MAVTLIIPAEAASIRLARLVATGFAAQLGANVADLDDLRIVVDELCSMLLSHAGGDDEITIRLASIGPVLETTVGAPARRPWQPDELSEGIVRTLGDDYRVDQRDGKVELVVHKSVEPPRT